MDMIVIDGRKVNMQVSNFANLEEVLVEVMQAEDMENRIVTDVILNDEAFSELYPHQAEDIDVSEIKSLEVKSVSIAHMAAEVTTELYKVIGLMAAGGKRVAQMLRSAEIASGLEVLQDVTEVTRHFLGMVALLRNEFSINRDSELEPMAEQLSSLIDEMSEVMEQEDWVLMADLAEFEFLPACESWNSVLSNLAEDIAQFKAA